MFQETHNTHAEDSNRLVVLVAYVLGAIGLFTAFVPILIALILCYIKRPEAAGTIYESHFQWLIRTFWFGLLWFVVALVLMLIGVGFLLYWVLCAWLVYRFVKGLLRFSERKAVV
ncbi:MAG: DUF4870 family protein [Limnobacter sp.]|uniref:DUF4870 family protein n=1 Tax=Limnobacter sp. TaxID=2003368 RepID=UPI003918AB46